MKLWGKALLMGLPLIASVGLLGVVQRLNPQLLPKTSVIRKCSQSAQFEVGYQLDEAFQILRNGIYSLKGISWLQTDLCNAGILEVTAYGEVVGDEAPQLMIALNDKVISMQFFDQKRTLKLYIPSAGHLILGYFNDYYQADVRVATLYRFRFSGPTCQAIPQIYVPPTTGGKWNPAVNVATIVNSVAMTAVPCGAGVLNFKLVG